MRFYHGIFKILSESCSWFCYYWLNLSALFYTESDYWVYYLMSFLNLRCRERISRLLRLFMVEKGVFFSFAVNDNFGGDSEWLSMVRSYDLWLNPKHVAKDCAYSKHLRIFWPLCIDCFWRGFWNHLIW